MLSHTNTDLLRHLPETHRPLTEHERAALAAQREAKRAKRTKTLDALVRFLGGLVRWTQARARPAKV